MKMRHLLRPTGAVAALLMGIVFLSLVAGPAWAKKYPEPSILPPDQQTPKTWQLKFRHGAPKRIAVAVTGQKTPTAYWYMTYTVVNESGEEQTFLPQFDMVTQDGKIRRSDQNVSIEVFQAIKKRESNALLKSATEISGRLHQGEDQAEDGVAIWEEPMARMGGFSIYVGGLSGEFVEMKGDDDKPMLDGDKKPIILRKTLELNYVVWGDEIKPEQDDVHDKPERWIMR
ncbi:MAG: hypothetical protein JWP03_4241 [Phycisphaerales bacterium]|jgi:hypothetical protein|nr:hypothetical protein [Phycisphaerales bacterium]